MCDSNITLICFLVLFNVIVAPVSTILDMAQRTFVWDTHN